MLRFANINHLWAHAIADELARCGVRHAVISPGSRSAPLVLALSGHRDITDHSVIDERAAAFFALGLAKASGQAVVLLCTSGTAAANYYPAVCEADASRVPLLLFTADRPGSLRGSGAPQTMDQVNLYGDHVRRFIDPGLPEADAGRLRALRSLVCHAFSTATADPAGPVHVNLPFRKPLEPTEAERDRDRIPHSFETDRLEEVLGRTDGRAWLREYSSIAADDALAAVVDPLLTACRPVILAGPDERGAEHAVDLMRIAERHHVPVFAEASSQLRAGERQPLRISTLDLLLRSALFRGAFQPDLIVQLGGVPTNTAVQRFLESASAAHVCIAHDHALHDATRSARIHVHDTRGDFIGRLSEFLSACPPRTPDPGFLDAITVADASLRNVLPARIAAQPSLFEGAVMHKLAGLLPAHCTVFVASSMPIRDVESFALDLPEGCALHFNRGVNGIDGIVSTALGVARARGGPALLITGDIAFMHDLNAAAGKEMREIPLTVLLLNNDGGEIFDMLPVREFEPAFSRHFITPHGTDFASACAAFGIEHQCIATIDGLSAALTEAFDGKQLRVIEFRAAISESGQLRRGLLRDLAADVGATLEATSDEDLRTSHSADDTVRDADPPRFPLAWRQFAPSGEETAVFLHGFTRSSVSWEPVIRRLSGVRAIGVDLMGHGNAPVPEYDAHPDAYGLDHASDELRAIIERLGLGKVHLVGYSLGGRTALHFASRNAGLLRSLALISTNPGIEEASERAQRREADRILADRIDHIGLERFVTEWGHGPLFTARQGAGTARTSDVLRDRMRRQCRGLKGSLLGSGQGAQLPLWDVLSRLDIPVLVAAGANDRRYAGIAAQMQSAMPRATLRLFEDAGHDLPAERDAELAQALLDLWKR